MQPIKILKYGIFDSKTVYGNLKTTPPRQAYSFELDFIHSCSKSAVSYIDEKRSKITPNMIIIRKPGETCHSDLHFKCYYAHIVIPESHALFNAFSSTPNFLTLINGEAYQNLFEEFIQHLIKHPSDEADFYILSKIYELIYRIEKNASQNQTVDRRNVEKETLSVQKAIEFMKANFSAQITLSDLGNVIGYSPNHFQKIFFKTMGISPQKFLEKLRVDHAKYLLMKNELSIASIAYECGFSSHPHFTKVFKQLTLLTPSEFRQKSNFFYSNN